MDREELAPGIGVESPQAEAEAEAEDLERRARPGGGAQKILSKSQKSIVQRLVLRDDPVDVEIFRVGGGIGLEGL